LSRDIRNRTMRRRNRQPLLARRRWQRQRLRRRGRTRQPRSQQYRPTTGQCRATRRLLFMAWTAVRT
jgi:hypothetical protein